MPTTLNLEPVLSFVNELSQHNNKVWFNAHHSAYEIARNTFEQFIDDIIDEFRASDHLQDLSAKQCIPRIYRDIRFSKDKSPYKTNLSAMIAPGGWKTTALGYYISIEAQAQSMVAGGLYQPTSQQLNRFRQAIDNGAATFRQITHVKDFVEAFGEIEGERLKTAPKGYDRSHPEIDLLQLKQITAVHRFSDKEVLATDLEGRVITACRAMRPFLDHLTGILR